MESASADNTVGSLWKSLMNLSAEAQSIVIGSLLGDAYLTPNGSLQIEHCLNQEAYVRWKYEKLIGIVGKPPKMVKRYDVRTDKTYRSIRFYTKAVLKEFRASFYKEKKILPEDLGEFLDPLSMAVWFMDDGSRGARTPKGMVFNTSAYSAEEQKFLQTLLIEKFGVQTSVHKVGKGFQLYIKAQSFEKFRELIFPNLIAEMRYKVPDDPVTT